MRQQLKVELAAIDGLECEILARRVVIGALISNARKRSGLSLRALADRAFMDHGYLHRVEAGAKKCSTGVMMRIIAALDPAPPPDRLVVGIRVWTRQGPRFVIAVSKGIADSVVYIVADKHPDEWDTESYLRTEFHGRREAEARACVIVQRLPRHELSLAPRKVNSAKVS